MENSVIFIDIEKRMLTANGQMNLSVQTSIPAGELVALFGESGAGKNYTAANFGRIGSSEQRAD